MRPARVVLIVGTGTEVGKTWVGCELIAVLRGAGVTVAARKPAQSFVGVETTDADLLARATGEHPTSVCPAHRWYEVPMAPPMAAEVLGRPSIRLVDLVEELTWPDADGTEPVSVGFVETAGGVRSPLAHDGDAVALADLLQPDLVLLVADARLGALNAVRLSTAPLAAHELMVFLNRFDPDDDLQCRNRSWLAARDDLDVVTDIADIAARLMS